MLVGSPPLPRAHSNAATRFASEKSWALALRIICALGAMPRWSGCVEAIVPATSLAWALLPPLFWPLGHLALTLEHQNSTGWVALDRNGLSDTPSSSWTTGRDE